MDPWAFPHGPQDSPLPFHATGCQSALLHGLRGQRGGTAAYPVHCPSLWAFHAVLRRDNTMAHPSRRALANGLRRFARARGPARANQRGGHVLLSSSCRVPVEYHDFQHRPCKPANLV